ncbi:hypothetical protein B0J12DRAFT_742187 [Macrophomina phaseolina]|uniref:Alcohol dehydrogenase superfamily zinc-containing n=1 Tax=Macrophomina phaseolina TaxID=35725 RepID=A0ABQ8G5C9_9PEZI|nr:hypothetical protein B0J12DRAFT_742187 [Macrophomina phaseolina]
MVVQDLPMPIIQNQTDAIVRITTSALCGSDLHVYRGVYGAGPRPMGHEAVGYVSELGSAVTSLTIGDYVVIPDTPSDGIVQLEPSSQTYYGTEELGGLQAQYARVPFADSNLIPIPLTHSTTNATIEQSYLTVSDILPTAWSAVTWSGFESGDTVAVWGAGPVGLVAAYIAIHRGASNVYIIDHVEQRLERAASIGAIPINFVESDPVEQILAYEPFGVGRSVDCVGNEALNANLTIDEDILLHQTIAATRFGGGIGTVGIYRGGPDVVTGNATDFPVAQFWSKALSWRGGPVVPLRLAPEMVQLVFSGRFNLSFIGTAEIGIEEVPEYYERFNVWEEMKVFIHP